MDEKLVMNALNEIFRSPSQLVKRATGLVFTSDIQPKECSTEDDPPEWDKRDERWTIDGLLGRYDAEEQSITIFKKGIEFAAPIVGLLPDSLEMIVRLHEYGHAIFHLGMTQAESTAMAGTPSNGQKLRVADTLRIMTQTYQDVDPYVHEQVAQSVTKIALNDLRAGATMEQSRKWCDKVIEGFGKLMQRQPDAYRLDHLDHLTTEQLRGRLYGFTILTRSHAVKPEPAVWNTVMPW
jgi:hypothetical protein